MDELTPAVENLTRETDTETSFELVVLAVQKLRQRR